MNDVINLLKNYKCSYEIDKIYKKQFLNFLALGKNVFDRDYLPGHFTASAFLLNKDMTKFALMHHAKLKKWLQFGGHCDGDDDLMRVAVKEVQEESGLTAIRPLMDDIFDLDFHLVPSEQGLHYHFDVRFILHAYNDNDFVQNYESTDVKWFNSCPEVRDDDYLGDSIFRMFTKWQNLKKSI